MNKYIIFAPHKCGSSVIRRMTADITNARVSPDRVFPISTDIGNAEVYFSRKFNFNEQIPKEGRLIFIPRNPISMCISAYYSFGYTHKQPRHISEDEFIRQQTEIQQMGLEKYIERRISTQCHIIENILRFDHSSKTIIPYELMITNFSDFLKHYLTAIDTSSSYQSIYSRWHKQFNAIEDQSDLIESGSLKPHKRTTDIYEWQKRLDPAKLNNLRERYSIINEYIELLSLYNL